MSIDNVLECLSTRPTPLQQCPPLFSKLLERGWNEDPCKRPTMRQISTLLDGLIDLILSPTHAMNPLQIPSDLPQKDAFLIRDTWDLEPHEPSSFTRSPPSDFSTVPGSLTVPHHVGSATDEQLKAMQIDSLDEDTPDVKRQKRPSKTEEPLSIVCNWERD
ncbi:hypothetical protein FGIG_09576 [Fasciola gigantica]|uniref:Serine-threonine/tyrosine-protein kinase catalytic domain-containing protein n=1 Tax=Fasciola gigantica TaxID=46835 RepID=A0A504YTA4_FASGI|nr:hypothetical protein FGIG_09576 [Fasciola gigantica]